MKVTVLPAAEADLMEAAAFYEVTGSARVAAKFVTEFRRVANLLLEFPGIGSPRPRGRRGFGLSLFPYSVIYRSTPDGVTVLVVKHNRRRPSQASRPR